ncbi:MAG TPA: type I-B CRISPR-associated protein Cas5b [Spirochaetota bacterium]|nr:type I-B CRISPR-associated protein Cas5 [Spirochaetota bacterium]HPY88150.1 type I-B CRISPR-associated protein Cas5b [Spirochaetota bacterium]HQB60141.1 type I-B CRISPR-associated protein Cas5b [Spirochaetota bacterium]
MTNKILIFDLFSDWGQVKKVFTTMSPLSFPFPSRTVIQGIIGAIVGIDKKINPETFIDENTNIAIRIINPVKKSVIPHNNIKVTSKSHFSRFNSHKPTNIEFLKDTKYRVYFSSENLDIYTKLKSQLENHCSIYNISIGISQCLANFEYIGEYDYQQIKTKDNVKVSSVFKKKGIIEIDFDDRKVFTVILPVRMKNDREVIDYQEYVYEADGKEIKLKTEYEIIEVNNGERIVFL